MSRPGSQTAVTGNLNSSEWRTLCLELLRRPPFENERVEFAAALARFGNGCSMPGPGGLAAAPAKPPGQPAVSPAPVDLVGRSERLVATKEFWQQWFEEQLYYFLLVDNFAPRGESMLSIPDELTAGTLHVRDAIHRIALSSSFDQRNPGADTFVTVVMEQLAGLAVEKNRRELEIGKGVYDGKPGSFLGRAGSTQSDVVRNAIEQRSFAETFLAREYDRYVHSAPAKSELKLWVDEFQSDPRAYTKLLRGWITSPAYRSRLARREPMDNRLFVRSLIVDLCQREPMPEEFSRMRSALDGLSDSQPLRSVMARLLLDSGQTNVPSSKDGLNVPVFVAEQFQHFLGRAPSEKEAREFASGLADPAGRPTMVVFALIAHPEYQSY